MKSLFKYHGGILLIVLSITACNKDKKPVVVFTESTVITENIPSETITDHQALLSIRIESKENTPVKDVGYCRSRTNPNPTLDSAGYVHSLGATNAPVTINTKMSDLNPYDTYYVRAYVTNQAGNIAYGETKIFKTKTGTVTDVEGNVYHTITIGNQVWMQENLKTILLNDYSAITNGNIAKWNTLGTTPAFCVNTDDSDYKNTFGLLYNWHAVNTGKLAPEGWRVPSNEDWNKMLNYLGGANVCGFKLKNNDHWLHPSPANTNSTGFTALPAGWRDYSGTFYEIGEETGFWANNDWGQSASTYFLYGPYAAVHFEHKLNKNVAFSVRCIRDLTASN